MSLSIDGNDEKSIFVCVGSFLLGKREENAYHAGGLGKACFVVQKNASRPAEDIVE